MAFKWVLRMVLRRRLWQINLNHLIALHQGMQSQKPTNISAVGDEYTTSRQGKAHRIKIDSKTLPLTLY